MNTFDYESKLVESFNKLIIDKEAPLHVDKIAHEFGYTSGKVDVVASLENKKLISFEAKLSKWKIALQQAYRNTSFSHYSYVVLPEPTSNIAEKYPDLFHRRGVGLCSVSNNKIKVVIGAKKKKPILPWLTKLALCFIEDKNER